MVQHVIRHGECFGKGGFFIRQTEQVLVGNDDQCIDDLLQRLDTVFSLTHPLDAFKLERLGHDTNGQNTQFTRGLRDDRRGPCPGAPAHTGGDKAHVRAGQVVHNLFNAFFGSGSTDRGPRARTQTFGHFDAQLNAAFRFGLLQRLRVCVGNHEINTVELFLDHVVHGVAACPANTKHCDAGFQVALSGH